MKNKFLTTLLAVAAILVTLPQIIFSAEIIVEPGVNTLNSAINSAENGDTLILKDGIYSVTSYPNNYYINKPLTIRAESKTVHPIVGHTNSSKYIYTTYNVVFQGITFLSGLKGSNFKVIECQFAFTSNVFTLIDASNVILIGNHFQPSSVLTSSRIEVTGTESIVAGNTFTNVSLGNTSTTSWTIGNSFEQTSTNQAYSSVIATGGNYAFVAGNRIGINTSTNSNNFTIYSSAHESLIAGNLIKFNIPDNSNIPPIYGGSTTSRTNIVNNVIHRSGQAALGSSPAIDNLGLGTIAGNIIVGHNFTEMIRAPYAQVSNNICHSNQGVCGSQTGLTVVDPMFEDLADFHLATGSPGIDAGPLDYIFSDLDHSRNDIGVYGGPWSIEQYDIQRDPSRTTPFAYPLLDPPVSAAHGTLSVRAIGAARLQY